MLMITESGERQPGVWLPAAGIPSSWSWAYYDGRYHRYDEDGSPLCGEGPKRWGETKTPGGFPWCRTCVEHP